jgi:TetR/AcrR family transcriptional regulator, transcriptional repressor for nem operon
MSDRKEEILKIAQHLTQVKGLNGFSYIDISKTIGIKTSSIHYYFKTKDDLAIAIIKRYHENFKEQLDGIDSKSVDPKEKLANFSEIFKTLASTKEKFCLCGMMAAELAALSEEACKELSRYFHSVKTWLSGIFSILGSDNPAAEAEAYLALLEGGLLLARVEKQPLMIERITKSFTNKWSEAPLS